MCSNNLNGNNIADTTTLCLQDWQRDNKYLRLDSEYQRLEILNIIDKLKEHGAQQLKDDNLKIIHPKEIERKYVNNEDAGTWFLRAQNVRPMRIDEGNRVFISIEDAECLKDNNLRNGDVLVTRSGANRGDSAVFNSTTEAIASSHTLVVRTNMIPPEILVAFLNSKFGKPQVERGVYGAAQPEVSPYYLKNIWIPKFSGRFEIKIKEAFSYSENLKEQAKKRFEELENFISTRLNFISSENNGNPLFYLSSLDKVEKARRLDAEYFQPLPILKARTTCIGYPQKRVFKPISEKNYKFIQLSDVGTHGHISSYRQSKGCLLPSRARQIIYENDVVVSAVQGCSKSIAIVPKHLNGSLCSTGFHIFKNDKFNAATLLLLLRTEFAQRQLRQVCSGGILAASSPKAIASVVLPLIDPKKQQYLETEYQKFLNLLETSRVISKSLIKVIELTTEVSEEHGLAELSNILETDNVSS